VVGNQAVVEMRVAMLDRDGSLVGTENSFADGPYPTLTE
jgi:hypothetical protein